MNELEEMKKEIKRLNGIIEGTTQVIEKLEGVKIKRNKPISELTDDELRKKKIKNKLLLKQRK